MSVDNVVSGIQNKTCFGCGVCASACPKKIISIGSNKDGFYVPAIQELDKCIQCGICLDVCSFLNPGLALKEPKIQSWAAWSKDDRVRRKCSSGGAGFEIGKSLIAQGYKVVGCRYNVEKQRAEHYVARTIEELVQSIGSKYIQSYTPEALLEIDRKQKYLVVGTPCQIDSFRRYIRKYRCEDNFVLMDFFCHCVPSIHAWNSYLKMVENKVGKATYVSWRNKFEYGWHDSWLMAIDGERTSMPVGLHVSYEKLIEEKDSFIKSRWSQGDLFYRLFLEDVCLGPQCQEQCKFKYDQSSADIRIGDLWGKTYEKDESGVSALVAFTEKGRKIVEGLDGVSLREHPFEVVAEGQMKKNAQAKVLAPVVMWMLRNKVPMRSGLYQIVLFAQRVINKINSL